MHLQFRGVVEVIFNCSFASFCDDNYVLDLRIYGSFTKYWMTGVSMIGSISFGIDLVAGRKRVPRSVAGIITVLIFKMSAPEL